MATLGAWSAIFRKASRTSGSSTPRSTWRRRMVRHDNAHSAPPRPLRRNSSARTSMVKRGQSTKRGGNGDEEAIAAARGLEAERLDRLFVARSRALGRAGTARAGRLGRRRDVESYDLP